MSHAGLKFESCIMAANTYIILISVPGEKSIFFMKRMISFITLAISNCCDSLHNFLVDFVSKGECVMAGDFCHSLL